VSTAIAGPAPQGTGPAAPRHRDGSGYPPVTAGVASLTRR